MDLKLKRYAILSWIVLACLVLGACEPLTTLPQPPAPTIPETTLPVGQTAITVQAEDSTVTVLPATWTPLPSETPIPSPAPLQEIRFGVIGDFGEGNQAEQDVADLVKSWNPDFVITVGDNNYPIGSAETIDQHIGKYYHEYIYPYHGAYGPGAETLRFFPTLGNHDWDSFQAQPYLEYFELPANERYYDFTWGPVYFVALDSDSRDPDGVSASSPQAQWAQERLASSRSSWKVVYFHAAPYSSGTHGPTEWMRWPFAQWGASAVLTGHDHTYERLSIDGIPYFVNGLGGGPIYAFHQVSQGSQFRYNEDYGAMLATADATQMTFQFFNRRGELIDSTQIAH
jgi:tartrate-resistant acid phosphatase type 5